MDLVASTYGNRRTFTKSLVSYIQKYGLDGVDIDWEYPKAPDRGGKPEDTDNFVLLMSDIRDAFDAVNPAWEVTLTIPTSYWYLRGFNVTRLQEYVDFFNIMSYDLVSVHVRTIQQQRLTTGSTVCGISITGSQDPIFEDTPTSRKSRKVWISFGVMVSRPRTS